MAIRERIALDALQDACEWIESGGEVAVSPLNNLVSKITSHRLFVPQVFDATNTTRDRRRLIYNFVVEKMGYKLLFVESICNDPKIVQVFKSLSRIITLI